MACACRCCPRVSGGVRTIYGAPLPRRRRDGGRGRGLPSALLDARRTYGGRGARKRDDELLHRRGERGHGICPAGSRRFSRLLSAACSAASDSSDDPDRCVVSALGALCRLHPARTRPCPSVEALARPLCPYDGHTEPCDGAALLDARCIRDVPPAPPRQQRRGYARGGAVPYDLHGRRHDRRSRRRQPRRCAFGAQNHRGGAPPRDSPMRLLLHSC